MQIDTKKLKAALAIAPKNHSHLYLNSVHYNSERNALEASDSYCAIRIAQAGKGELLNKNIIIPREAAKAAVKLAEQDVTPIYSDFPNFDKVMPQEYQDTGAEHPAFNIYLLNKWRKAQEAMNEELIPIWRPMMIKENQALQTLDDMTFVVMATIHYG